MFFCDFVPSVFVGRLLKPMPVPGDFHLTSEQRGILKQALHYKHGWERDERTAFGTAYKTALERANRDVAAIIVRQQEQQGVLPSIHTGSGSSHRPGKGELGTLRARAFAPPSEAGLTPVPSVVASPSSATPSLREQKGHRGGGTSVEGSHHAVSSIMCRDASDVTDGSSRVRQLEAQLREEEAKRIQVHKELQEIRSLIESRLPPTKAIVSGGEVSRRGTTPAAKQISLRALSNGRYSVDLRGKVKSGKTVIPPPPYASRLQ